MDQDTRKKPDGASPASNSPRLGNMWDASQMEAHKEAMIELLRSNTAYMDSGMRLYRQPDAGASASSRLPNLSFYGSLMDPDVVQSIAGPSVEPKLHKASIRGYKLKMWGIYIPTPRAWRRGGYGPRHILVVREY